MAPEKESFPVGRRHLRRGTAAEEFCLGEEVGNILNELAELIHSAELALAAGKYRRQSEHVCVAICLRMQKLHEMLSPTPEPERTQAPPNEDEEDGEGPRRGLEGLGSNGRARNNVCRGRNATEAAGVGARQQSQRDPRGLQQEEADGVDEREGEQSAQGAGVPAKERGHWPDQVDESQREAAGTLVARLPAIVKRFTHAQRARVCDVADNLMQVMVVFGTQSLEAKCFMSSQTGLYLWMLMTVRLHTSPEAPLVSLGAIGFQLSTCS